MGMVMLGAVLSWAVAICAMPLVHVPGLGKLEGVNATEFSDVCVFRGIPYAKPPVGDLRWRSPVPHGPWESPRAADQFGAACIPYFPSPDVSVSEDCLFLNVATPQASLAAHGRDRLPVMVYIHGGSYRSGASNNAQTEALVHSSGILVVNFNYRLNIFGFLGASVLQNRTDDRSTGNYGLDDQRLALGWVRRHIGAFGGRGDRVTIFGQSAGGSSVLHHLVQRLSFGLYKQAIVQSGGYLSDFSMEYGNARLQTWLNRTDCTDVACLLQAPAAQLGELVAQHTDSWGPTIDGVRLTGFAQEMIARGEYNRGASVIIGSVRDEESYIDAATVAANLTEAEFQNMLDQSIFAANASQLKALYAPSAYNYPEYLGNYSRYWWEAMRITTDGGTSRRDFQPSMGLGQCSARCVARLLHDGGARSVFAYMFSHPSQEVIIDKNVGTPVYGTYLGSPLVPHASDCAYTIGLPSALNKELGEVDLASNISRYWANFARYGNPNSASLPEWPVYDPSMDVLLSFDVGANGITPKSHIRSDVCDFWDQQPYSVCGMYDRATLPTQV